MLADRISAAAELWQAGRVRRILVTGDETLRGQVSVMARELGRLGVPEHALVLDRPGSIPGTLFCEPATSSVCTASSR